MVKDHGHMRSRIEKMKNIIICDLFYEVTVDIVGLLSQTKSGNKYVLVVINDYSKWCETKLVKEHITTIVARFFEEEIICKFGVPKYVLIDNGGEWTIKFDMMCNFFGITHQFITP